MRATIPRFLGTIIGFCLGQGAFFLLQSYMMHNANYERMTQLALGIGIANLLQWSGDASAGQLQQTRYHQTGNADFLGAMISQRLLIAFSAYLLAVTGVFFYSDSVIFSYIIICGGLSGCIWSFNVQGVNDYISKSYWSPIFLGMPYLFSVVLAVSFISAEDKVFGCVVGTGYIVGSLICVIAQHLEAKRSKVTYKLSLCLPEKAELKREVLYFSYFGPAQAYGRVLQIILNAVLGATISAYYIYCKSIINIFMQLIMILRRLEFAKILALTKASTPSAWTIIKSQKISLLLGICFFPTFILFSLFAVWLNYMPTHFVIDYAAPLAALTLLWLLGNILGQYVFRTKISTYVLVMNFSIALSLLLMLLLDVKELSVFYVVEAVMYLFQVIVFLFLIRTWQHEKV